MKAWLGKLYIQVLIGLILGATIGYFLPDLGIKLQPLAERVLRSE
jgi:aerobic C4-dicarboxylate transport protein